MTNLEAAKNRIENIRTGLDIADRTHDKDLQIGHILIAIGQLTDLIEMLIEKELPTPAEPDRYAAARQEYQAERRIDEYAAYQRETDYGYGE